MSLLNKLESIRKRWEDVGKQITDPAVIADMKKFTRLSREYRDLEEIVQVYEEYRKVTDDIASARKMLETDQDPEMKDLAREEIDSLEPRKEDLEEQVKALLVPKDPEDARNAVIEIRAGTGGDEAAIFAGDLYRMYTRFAERKGWKVELVDFTPGTAGGYKEIIINLIGPKIYGTMKYESGVHRVQRVPQTETQGRIHTSAASVAVLPEADEFDVDIKQNDIRKDTFCSSGPGGQSVNTTYSAIRLTHIPTGIVVSCQDEKSQLKNLDKAMRVLRSRVYELEFNRRQEELARKRKTMVSTGDRSAKIRTYNYPQSRVTDHRIGFTQHNLPDFMNGSIDEMLSALQVAENAERLREGTGSAA